MPDNALNDVLTAVGPRIRALRRAHNVTLAQVSVCTGISLSTLSRLESGQRKPTLELLLPLAKAYRVVLDELVGAPETGDPRTHLRPINRDGKTLVPLTRYVGGVVAYKQVLPPTEDPDARPEPEAHRGYVWGCVLAGRIRLVLGDDDRILTAGEAVAFDTRTPHGIANAGRQPAEFLSLFGPQGERIHQHARHDANA